MLGNLLTGSGGAMQGQNPFKDLLRLSQEEGAPVEMSAVEEDPFGTIVGEDMEVIGSRGSFRPPEASMPRYGDAPSRAQIDPRYVLQGDDRIAPLEEEFGEIIPRKGLFGMKGTLRDVVGLLGDAFLVGSGADRQYSPRREQERIGDAMYGMKGDGGESDMAAVQRLAAAGYPKEAQSLFNQIQQQQVARQNALSQEEARKASAQGSRTNALDKVQTRLSAYANNIKTAEDLLRALPLMENYAKANGVDLTELVGENPTLEDFRLMAAGGMNVNQQEQLVRKDRSLDQGDTKNTIAQQNANANTTRANRPPAARATPNPTNASQAAPLLRKVQAGQTLTPGETETLNRLGYSADRGQGKTGGSRSAAIASKQSGTTTGGFTVRQK